MTRFVLIESYVGNIILPVHSPISIYHSFCCMNKSGNPKLMSNPITMSVKSDNPIKDSQKVKFVLSWWL